MLPLILIHYHIILLASLYLSPIKPPGSTILYPLTLVFISVIEHLLYMIWYHKYTIIKIDNPYPSKKYFCKLVQAICTVSFTLGFTYPLYF